VCQRLEAIGKAQSMNEASDLLSDLVREFHRVKAELAPHVSKNDQVV